MSTKASGIDHLFLFTYVKIIKIWKLEVILQVFHDRKTYNFLPYKY